MGIWSQARTLRLVWCFIAHTALDNKRIIFSKQQRVSANIGKNTRNETSLSVRVRVGLKKSIKHIGNKPPQGQCASKVIVLPLRAENIPYLCDRNCTFTKNYWSGRMHIHDSRRKAI